MTAPAHLPSVRVLMLRNVTRLSLWDKKDIFQQCNVSTVCEQIQPEEGAATLKENKLGLDWKM